jgi:hypothetical protein
MLNPTDKLFAKAHFSTLALVVVLFLVAMILGPLAWGIVADHLQAGCDAGTLDAGTCLVAELSGVISSPAAQAQGVVP